MKEHLKNFGKGVLLGLLLNLLLGVSFVIIQGYSIVSIFYMFFLGLILFGLIFVVYEKFGGKKPVHVLSVVAAFILILSLGFQIISNTFIKQPQVFESYFYVLLFLGVVFFLGLILLLVKIVKENKLVVISTVAWYLITLGYYLFVGLLLFVATYFP